MPRHHTISAGGQHSLVIDQLGRVWAFGDNSNGELGLGDIDDRVRPTLIEDLSFIVSVSAGNGTSWMLDQDGYAWFCGYNAVGSKVLKPIRFERLPFIVAVAAGDSYSLLLDRDGQVWSFGYNKHGQLGLGDTEYHPEPTPIKDLPFIVDVAAGDLHSLVLDKHGKVWSFGNNLYGQLGLGKATLYGVASTLNNKKPNRIEGLPFITKISAGNANSLVLDRDGYVWSFGNNESYRLGLGDERNRSKPTRIEQLPVIIDIAAGAIHNLLLDQGGKMWSFGGGNGGQLGIGFVDHRYKSRPTLINGLPSIVSISCYKSHNLASGRTGIVWSFGSNNSGQLGLGDRSNRYDPVEIPDLVAHVPERPEFVLSVYSIMEPYLDQMTDARVNSYEGEDTIMEIDLKGVTYLVRLQYDPLENVFSEPTVSDEDKYVNLFNDLIENNGVKRASFLPVFYSDEEGNEAFMFEDLQGQRYVTRAHP